MNRPPSMSGWLRSALLLTGALWLARFLPGAAPHPVARPAPAEPAPAPAVARRPATPPPVSRPTPTRRRWVVADSSPRSVAAPSRALADELLVILRPGVDPRALAARVGAELVGEIPAARTVRLRFATAEDMRAAAALLRADPAVAGLDRNYTLPKPETPRGVEPEPQTPASLALTPVTAESPIVIGLVDSAVGAQGTAADGFLLHPANGAAAAEPTHGVAVLAAILEGLANGLGEDAATTGVKVVPVDVYNGAEETTSYQVAEGMLAALEQGATIVNLSLGGPEPENLMRSVITAGDNAGVVFIGAAGNEPVSAPTYPAAYDPVLAVTSVDASGAIDPQVNHGDFVDVGAPGTVRFPYGDRWYETSGTSISAGYVSGLTAGLAERLHIPVADAAVLVSEQYSPMVQPPAP